MSKTIQEFVAEREIKVLTHFTRESNLASILQRGLICRDKLVSEGKANLCNDQLRLDGTNAVCASITFPNYKMFWGLRKDNPGVEWVVLGIRPSVMWETRAAFCSANAASTGVTVIPVQQRMGVPAFQAMFDDFGTKVRASMGLKNAHPTNPQAEVLLLDGVALKYVIGAYALNQNQKTRIEQQHPGFQVVVNAGIYRYRSDYENWK